MSRAPRRILVTRLRFLGDVVLSTPLIRALREAAPQARLEYLTEAAFAPALQHHPDVDAVHALPARAGLAAMWRWGRSLRSPRIDWWIDLFGNPRSAQLCFWARPRVSVGSGRGLRSRVFTHRVDSPADDPSACAHHMEKLAPLLGHRPPAGPTRLHVGAEESAAMRGELGLTPETVVLHPGSTWPSKAWPDQGWLELIEHLRTQGMADVVLITPPGQEDVSARLTQASGARALPALSVRQLLGVLRGAPLYVGNDGGILHCAVALGTPTVGIFGPTEPEIWFPYEHLGPYRLATTPVPCRGCHLHSCSHLSCLRPLSAASVAARVNEVLALARRSSHVH